MDDFTDDDFFREPRRVIFNDYDRNRFNFNPQLEDGITTCNRQYTPSFQNNDSDDIKTWQNVDAPMKKFQELSMKTPVVGLEYVSEFYDFENRYIKAMVCDLCEVQTLFLKHMLDHVIGFKHKLKYLQVVYQDKYKLLLSRHKHMENKEIKEDLLNIYKKLSIENPLFQMRNIKVKNAYEYKSLEFTNQTNKNTNCPTKGKFFPLANNKEARKRKFQNERRQFEEQAEDKLIIEMNSEETQRESSLLEEDDDKILHFLVEDARRFERDINVVKWMQPADRKSLYDLVSERERFSKGVNRLQRTVQESSMSEAEKMIKHKLQSALHKAEADINDFLLHSTDEFKKENPPNTFELRQEGFFRKTQSYSDNFFSFSGQSSDSNLDMDLKNCEELNSLRENILLIKKNYESQKNNEVTSLAKVDQGEASTSGDDVLSKDARAVMEEKIFKALCEGSLAPIAKVFADNPDLQAALKKWDAKQDLIATKNSSKTSENKSEVPEVIKNEQIPLEVEENEIETKESRIFEVNNKETKKEYGNITPPCFMQEAIAKSWDFAPYLDKFNLTSERKLQKLDEACSGMDSYQSDQTKQNKMKPKQSQNFTVELQQRPYQATGDFNEDHVHDLSESYHNISADYESPNLTHDLPSYEKPISSQEWSHEFHERPHPLSASHYESHEHSFLGPGPRELSERRHEMHDQRSLHPSYDGVMGYQEYEKTNDLYSRYSRKFYENEILPKGNLIRMKRPPLVRNKAKVALLTRPRCLLTTPQHFSRPSYLGTLEKEGHHRHQPKYKPRAFPNSGVRLQSGLHRRLPKRPGYLVGNRPPVALPMFDVRPKFPRM